MKKSGFALLVGLLVLFGLTACSGNGGGEPSASPSLAPSLSPIPSANSSPDPSQPSESQMPAEITEIPVTTPAQASSSPNIVYVNDRFGFQLQIPASWSGLYEISEEENGVTFSNAKNKEAGYGGTLFQVFVTEEEPEDLPDYQMFSFYNGQYMGIMLPTDVQFDGSDPELAQEYQTMARDIDSIKESATAIPQ